MSGLQLDFKIHGWQSIWHTIKKLYKPLNYRSTDLLKINFLEKGLQKVLLPFVVYDFSRKMFHML